MSFLKIFTTHQLKLKESKKETRKSSKASAWLSTLDFIIDFDSDLKTLQPRSHY